MADAKLYPEFADWLDEVNGSAGEAFCKVCKVTFSLSNMGRRSVVSHADSSKHKKYTYLRAMHNLFRDSPARRAAYTEITGSKVFPKKFCRSYG